MTQQTSGLSLAVFPHSSRNTYCANIIHLYVPFWILNLAFPIEKEFQNSFPNQTKIPKLFLESCVAVLYHMSSIHTNNWCTDDASLHILTDDLYKNNFMFCIRTDSFNISHYNISIYKNIQYKYNTIILNSITSACFSVHSI